MSAEFSTKANVGNLEDNQSSTKSMDCSTTRKMPQTIVSDKAPGGPMSGLNQQCLFSMARPNIRSQVEVNQKGNVCKYQPKCLSLPIFLVDICPRQ